MQKQPEFAAVWLAQKRAATARLRAIARAELAALSDDEALRRTEALLDMVEPGRLSEERLKHSGLVEQQRRFHRGRR